ncbi:MAG: hypothetical protein ACI89L_001647 [Phycisphaerales bacterium]|jgi:hypothetical protein
MRYSSYARVSPAAFLAMLAGSAISNQALAQSTTPFPAEINLSSLNGSDGFVINGLDMFDVSGESVSSAGDVNGDGIDDLIIGASGGDPNGISYAGESYVVFGAVGVGSSGSINLWAINGSNGFVINGIDADDRSGISVSSAGDVNGDGIDDLIIGAHAADPNGNSFAGESYVVFGAVGVGSGGSINLSSLNGSNGFVINGIDASDLSGESVSSAGDVNGDGIDDLLIGAISGAPNGIGFAGESYVVFGAVGVGSSGSINLSSLNGSNGFVLNGVDVDDRSGISVSSAGDMNGDGVDDVIIGAYRADPNGIGFAGESYVVFGAVGVGSSGSINLSSLNGSNGFVLKGISGTDFSGRSVSSAGDVNGDGYDDVIIGAYGADPNGYTTAGESYVVFGAVGVGSNGSINLSSLNGTNGFVLNGIWFDDQSGISVSSPGDVNGDGYDDLIIGANEADPNGNANAGESYIVFGAPAVGAGGSFNLSTLSGNNGFQLNGIDALDYSGSSVSSAGDINGDGVDDLIIGARGADPVGGSAAGESYVVFGRANTNIWTGTNHGDWDLGGNWLDGQAPIAGFARIEPTIGVTVTGPSGAAFLDRLLMSAQIGRTTLDLQPGSLVSVDSDFSVLASAALSGSGLFVANGGVANDGLITPEDLFLIAVNGLSNHGDLDLSALTSPSGFARMQVGGTITNETDGEILMRHGSIELEVVDGMINAGSLDVAFATAAVLGPINNTASGSVSISGVSSLLITDDVTNASTIVLTDDSSLVILGSIIGNGVSGPGGGGTAGTVFIEGGVIPGILGQPLMTSSFDGDLDLGPAAHTIIEIGGTNPGVTMDQLASATNLGIGGTLDVQLVNGYVPQPGDVYPVLQFATASGSFSSIVMDPGLIAAGANTADLLTNGTIFIEAPCPADTNGDGFLDNGDIITFVSLFLAGDIAADMNGDGFLDNGDIITFVSLFLAGC